MVDVRSAGIDSMIVGKKIDKSVGSDTLYFMISMHISRWQKPVDTIGFSDYYYYLCGKDMKLIFTNGRLYLS